MIIPKRRYVIGIDPGLHGAYALLQTINDQTTVRYARPTPVIKGDKGNAYDMPAIAGMFKEVAFDFPGASSVFVVIERQQAMPQQGVKSMFQIGVGYGMWLAMIASHSMSYIDVQAKVWQKMLAGMNCPDDTKLRSIRRVQQFFPDYNLVQTGCRTPHDGVADAINIAHYGVLHMQ